MDDSNTPTKTYNVIELADYSVDFQIVQNPNKSWTYCLQIFPEKNNPGILDNDEFIPELGHVKKMKEADAVLLYGREHYTNWEYAGESALDIIELLGFRVNEEIHYFDVCFWDAETHERKTKKGMSDGLEFKLVQQTTP
jgi:hypothetical protein